MLWRKVTADVIGYPLEEVAHHPGSSLGAAFVAGMGIGAYAAWSEIEKYIEVTAVTNPDYENHARYVQLFRLYRELYEANKARYRDLAAIVSISQD
jgi:xylulokinase